MPLSPPVVIQKLHSWLVFRPAYGVQQDGARALYKPGIRHMDGSYKFVEAIHIHTGTIGSSACRCSVSAYSEAMMSYLNKSLDLLSFQLLWYVALLSSCHVTCLPGS
ncbi:Uncharacterized protein HZ326_9143 [Fusarium oxysporum f. sp. albedinis]|nr:Uncharacterized protein HZ326_9143 [Fusarium oxysporum f. sp. albedinis]